MGLCALHERAERDDHGHQRAKYCGWTTPAMQAQVHERDWAQASEWEIRSEMERRVAEWLHKKRTLAVAVLLLLWMASPAFAQSAPNRSAEVDQLLKGKYAGRLNGNDDVRREVLRGICVDLNVLDAGRWGLLIKNDQGGRITADILVWRPTRVHFDVLSDYGPSWQDDGPLPEAWGWLECAPTLAPPPPPVIVLPPPVAPPVELNAAALAEIKALAAEAVKEIKEHRAAVSREYYKWAAILGPFITGLVTWLQLRVPH